MFPPPPHPPTSSGPPVLTRWRRFVDTEKWREETKLDELVPIWEFPEKAAMFKYYPQYYHKTDKVGCPKSFPPCSLGPRATELTRP